MKIKIYVPYVLAIAALMIGAFYDYEITDALHGTAPTLGIFFERIVLIPIEGIVMFTMCMFYRKYHHVLFLFLALLGAIYAVADALHYWIDIKSPLMLGIVLLVSVISVYITYFILSKVSNRWIYKHLSFFMFFTIVLLCSTLITTLIKEFWGRIRYRDMEEVNQFCVWYKPCGLAGNRSFPSGHITAMTCILCILQWKDNHYEKVSIVRYVIVTAFILTMALSRMIMGAHFLSDLAMGFIITYSTYIIIKTIFMRRGIL